MMINRFRVYNENGRVVPTTVEINGKSIHCRSVKYEAAVDSIPTVHLELNTLSDIDVANIGQAWISISPSNLAEANEMVRFELSKRDDYYKGNLLTIESALMDSGITNAHDIACHVLDRMIGDDI